MSRVTTERLLLAIVSVAILNGLNSRPHTIHLLLIEPPRHINNIYIYAVEVGASHTICIKSFQSLHYMEAEFESCRVSILESYHTKLIYLGYLSRLPRQTYS